MKSLLFIIMMPLAFLTNTDHSSPLQSTESSVGATIEIELGRKKKGCAGLGICSFSASSNISGIMETGKVGANLTIESGSVTAIEFDKKSMSASTIKKYFSNGVFVVDETVKESGDGFIMYIDKGKYKLQPSSRGFLLEVSGAKKVEVDVELEIGRKKKGCAGFGVCSIVVSGGVKGVGGAGKVAATLTVQNDNVTAIEFHKESMDARTLKTYFAGGVFKVEEAFRTTVRQQGFTLNLKIGDYKLRQTKTGFLLEV